MATFLLINCPGCGMLRALGDVKEGDYVTLPTCTARGCAGVSGVIARDKHDRLGLREQAPDA